MRFVSLQSHETYFTSYKCCNPQGYRPFSPVGRILSSATGKGRSGCEAMLAGMCLFQTTCPSAFPKKNRAEARVHPEAGLEMGSNLGGVPTREPSPVLHRALARRAVWWDGGVHECPLIHAGFPLSLMGSAMAETTAPSCVSAWPGEKI